ncbi:hypothetical protein CH333_06875 [candidate division WOR-3 bacterium JGI_Cruoil_03_44_89]|uniref:Glycosyl transferase family 1 domain-containing protein n=1 Tax=candidate division WOR-3 bacterium JGI_Cruoil_03_44_89 TaxID=1973748 RepID=A0A235BS11_UNCW3|nr:MAG: hypothetical protein CH333_06875 [candidate division WOR-3 bacterium JGI_Cruoil_03_44_89]
MKESRKVLLLSPVASIGGGESVLLDLATYLPSFGIQVIALCLKSGPLVGEFEKRDREVHIFEIPQLRRLDRLLSCILYIKKLVRQKRIDLIHSNHTGHLAGLPAARLAHIPELWHIHDVAHKKDLTARLLEDILPPEHILFTTPEVERGCSNFKVRARSTSVICPGIDIERIKRSISETVQQHIRHRYKIPENIPLCLTVTRMQEHKGHRYLLECAHILKERKQAVHFAIAGEATGEKQKKYLNELKCMVNNLGLVNNVSFLGFVNELDLHLLMQDANVLVHPALSEGFGLVILESLALGTPVIAAAAEGPTRILKDGEGGLLVPPGNPTALANAVAKFLNDKELQKRLAQRGVNRAQQFTSRRMARETANLYMCLLG